MAYESINPYNGKTLKTFEATTDAQLETALETAAICFDTWRHTSFAEHTAVVTKAAALMRARDLQTRWSLLTSNRPCAFS